MFDKVLNLLNQGKSVTLLTTQGEYTIVPAPFPAVYEDDERTVEDDGNRPEGTVGLDDHAGGWDEYPSLAALWEKENPVLQFSQIIRSIPVEHLTGHTRITLPNGKRFDYGAAVNLMDDDLREELHNELAPCSPQLFFDEYCRRHLNKYGEEFVIN